MIAASTVPSYRGAVTATLRARRAAVRLTLWALCSLISAANGDNGRGAQAEKTPLAQIDGLNY